MSGLGDVEVEAFPLSDWTVLMRLLRQSRCPCKWYISVSSTAILFLVSFLILFSVGRSASSTAVGYSDARGCSEGRLSAALVFMVSDDSVAELVGEASSCGFSSSLSVGSPWAGVLECSSSVWAVILLSEERDDFPAGHPAPLPLFQTKAAVQGVPQQVAVLWPVLFLPSLATDSCGSVVAIFFGDSIGCCWVVLVLACSFRLGASAVCGAWAIICANFLASKRYCWSFCASCRGDFWLSLGVWLGGSAAPVDGDAPCVTGWVSGFWRIWWLLSGLLAIPACFNAWQELAPQFRWMPFSGAG